MKIQRGFGMIEVLVTIIVLAVGLLGMAGLQARAQRVELESYQRVQALILLDDIASRLRSNREGARCYETVNDAGFVGTDSEDATAEPTPCAGWGTTSSRRMADTDLQEWDDLLEGSAETRNNNRVGSMTGARGCIAHSIVDDTDVYTISVAWQGEVATAANASNTCAQGTYGSAELRRVVSRAIRIPELD